LLHKIREDQQGPKLKKALDYMQNLTGLVGKPDDVLSQARQLVEQYEISADAIHKLSSLMQALKWYGDIQGKVEIDLGLNRGLHYYTGLMFEIHYLTEEGEEIQLAGGGRYDNLVTILGGGAPTPALGFAYGIERIASVVSQQLHLPPLNPQVFIIPIEEGDLPYAFKIANKLRSSGHSVEVSIDKRNVKKSLKHADKRNSPIVLIVGEKERDANQIVVRDMVHHTERTIAFDDISQEIEGLRANHVYK